MVCAILLSVVTVSAASTTACQLPADGKTAKPGECVATVNGDRYAAIGDAWTEAKKGGEMVLYSDLKISNAETIIKAVTIKSGEHKVTLDTGTFTINDGGSLTIEGAELNVSTTGKSIFVVNEGGKLVLNSTKTTATNSSYAFITVNGVNADVEVKGTVEMVRPLVSLASHGASVKLNATAAKVFSLVTSSQSGTPDYGTTATVVTVNGGSYTTTSDAFTIDHATELKVVNGTVTSAARVLHLLDGVATINNGEFVAKTGTGIFVEGSSEDASLTVSGGKVTALGSKYALSLTNPKATYAISGGTFAATGSKGKVAIELGAQMLETKDGKTNVIAKVNGILTGGKYLNDVIAEVVDGRGATINVSNQLVAEDYTVKEEVEGKDTYKVVVLTKAENDKKPAAKPEEQAPNTYDAGLVYSSILIYRL